MTRPICRPPNYRCRVSEPDDPRARRSTQLVYAENEGAACELLEELGFVVHSIKPYDFGTEWQAIASRETDKAIAAHQQGQTYEFKAIWGALKEHLQYTFHGKCAYCDAKFLHIGFGDVEHYRPKGAVTNEQGHKIHPGYYWLAYELSNYLPSCQKCNQKAKKNQFPISGTRATQPGDPLDQEKPLLINPCDHDFDEHVRFRPSTSQERAGWADPLDEVGDNSIKVYRLNRPWLYKVRLEEQARARLAYKQALANWLINDVDTGRQRIISECKSGVRQFSAAVVDEIEAFCTEKTLPSPFDG
jgi:uncharacterized protein (TIGR02646 family)